MARSKMTLPYPLGEKVPLPPHHKSAVFLHPANPSTPLIWDGGWAGGLE